MSEAEGSEPVAAASNSGLAAFAIAARNLPEHQDNPIHTDDGARRQGFPGALVAGVTVYAYLTRPPAAGWGVPWLTGGASEVRFRRPVAANAALTCQPTVREGSDFVDAVSDGELHATCQVWLDGSRRAPAPMVARPGDQLRPLDAVLDDHWARYGQRCGDELSLYDDEGLAHPSVWPCLANRLTHQQLVDGPWIHTRSKIVHLGRAERGDQIRAEAVVVDRFDTRR
ncbi:MAG: hypothetical protein R2706_13280 [Acidimicrobiales bacterium]